MPDRAPQGRRVERRRGAGPYSTGGPCFVYETRRKAKGRYDAAAHLALLGRHAEVGPVNHSGVVVLDTYSVHRRHPVKAAGPTWAASGVAYCFPPASSPELNQIEALWKQVKVQDLPERSYLTDTAL